MEKLEQLTRLGWRIVEAALVLVVLCVLLNLLLGQESGAFIASVAGNVQGFLQSVPPGSFLGVVLILLIYWVFKSRGSV